VDDGSVDHHGPDDDGRPNDEVTGVGAGAEAAGVEEGVDDGHEVAVGADAPVRTRAEARARAAAAAPRRLDVPLVLIAAAAGVAVAGIAALLWLFGSGTPPNHVAARPPTSQTRPPPGTAAAPFPGVVALPPPSTSATTVLTLRPVAVGDASAGAPIRRPAAPTTATTGTEGVAARLPSSYSPSPHPTPRFSRTARPAPPPPARTSRPQQTSVPPVPAAPPGPPAVTPAPPVTTPAAPGAPGAPAVVSFEPSTVRGYTALIVAPPGWSITSVRDVRGRHVLEHVRRPSRTFEGRLRPGPLVVEVTPGPGATVGTLFAWFTDRTGALLPGSGGQPLP
jgi:hypothetical protein